MTSGSDKLIHKLIRVSADDWEAYYDASGQLLHQGHSVDAYNLARGLGYNVVSLDMTDEWSEKHGFRCPTVLSGDDIKELGG